MKSRGGFVSNSSSSSYVVVMTAEKFAEVMASLPEYTRAVVRLVSEDGKVGSQAVKVTACMTGECSTFSGIRGLPKPDQSHDDPWDAFDEFLGTVEGADDVIVNVESC